MGQIVLEEKDILHVIKLIKQGFKMEAVAEVQALTQAGLKNSKDYVDSLLPQAFEVSINLTPTTTHNQEKIQKNEVLLQP